jgi:adhesin/invasin
MVRNHSFPWNRVWRLLSSLAAAMALLVLGLALMDGLAHAGPPQGVTRENVEDHSSAPSQPGVPNTITMWTTPPSPIYANGINVVTYTAEIVDTYGNPVTSGIPVTVLYDLREMHWHGGDFDIKVKYTDEAGQVFGGWERAEWPGTITFTAWANLTATAFVTAEFIYNPAAAITITAVPTQILMGGGTAVISASLEGVHGGYPSDGTVVSFETSLGTISPSGATTYGVAQTTLTSGTALGTATITATVDLLQATTTVEIVAGSIIYLPVISRDG